MRKLLLGALIASLSVGAVASEDGETDVTKFMQWGIDDAPEIREQHMRYDLDPETRLIAEEYLVAYKGYTLNQVKLANRSFILFNKGSDNLTASEKSRISRFLANARKGDHLVITGYARDEGVMSDLAMAERRADTITKFIRQTNKSIMINKGSTLTWGSGDEVGSRRAEIFMIKSVE